MYSEVRTNHVLCLDCWNSDDRDPFAYQKEYDFSIPFFKQMKDFRENFPILFAHHTGTLVRSEYTNYSKDNKDCYLSYSVIGCENVMYSEVIDKSMNSIDSYAVQKIDGCSYNLDCENNYNSHYILGSRNCIDSFFLYDCINCQNCCMSSNLRNKQYYFKNEKLSKEDYEKKFNDLKLQTYTGFMKGKEYFNDLVTTHAIHRFAQVYNSQNASGDYIGNSNNIYYSFDVQNAEDIKYSVRVLMNAKDCYDNQGIAAGELIYESVATSFNTYKDNFTYICVGSRDCEYALMCTNCSNCFGCVGLKNAQYCILNKQYSKEEYFGLIEKIKQHMMDMPYIDTKGRMFKYGEFFPYDLSPFGYNETNAHDNFLMTRDEAKSFDYPWKEPEIKDYSLTINSLDLPDSIVDTTDDVLKEVITCPNIGNQFYQCTTAFRITKEELSFNRQKGLPLPRYCPNCRHYERLKYRNPMRLYKRSCSNGCGREFETTYAPDRPEKVYCEQCYQAEVL